MAKNIKTVTTDSKEELMSLAEAIQFLGISKPTIYRMLERGDVKGMKVGNQWRFRKVDLTAYLNRDSLAVATAGVSHDLLDEELAFFYTSLEKPIPDIDLSDDPREQKVIALTSGILAYAVKMRSSDIHLEAIRGNESKVEGMLRYRIDGVLHEIRRFQIEIFNAIIQRLKIMSAMNPDEKRLPQDGRILLRIENREIDLRVNLTPMVYGESMVARILDQSTVFMSLDKVSLAEDNRARMREIIRKPCGMVLCTGPTGSGKTTVLYSCLMDVVSPEKKVLTIEDPVEYMLPGTSQSQVRAQFGYTFPVAMRSFLRQDPDIIMVGEIRDLETCYISMQAALTGHMIFSTLHTNSAVGTITRMLDMGVEPFLISASITGIINQRLVRKLCPHCKQPVDIDAAQMSEMGMDVKNISDATFFRSVGCSECGNRGFRGRIAIYEILCMTPHLGDVISKRLPEEEMLKAAIEGGMRTMMQDGMQMAAKGITTIDEVLRVLR